jgi:signal transduction histidine kinase
MDLADVIVERREEILRRWMTLVQGRITPEAMPGTELLDQVPVFLEGIVALLREKGPPSAEVGAAAAEHGEQRLRLGFSLDAVVREYGALRNAIVAMAQHEDVQVTPAELQIVFDCIIAGIASAVNQYTQQRDAELRRQANEHFAFVAHELRGPLSSASIAVALLRRHGQLPVSVPAVGALERGLERAVKLIDQDLDVARGMSGVALDRRPTKVRRLLEDECDSVLAEAQDRHIEIAVDAPAELTVEVDRRLTASAVGNLLRNAVKYSRDGGKVDVRAAVVNGRVTIEIEDACGGLPPGAVEKAFSPFVRFNDRPGGYGLGLAIAKQAADAHGGGIRIQNLPGKGCIFALELPGVLAATGDSELGSGRGLSTC